MTEYDPKADLRLYLRRSRDAMVWKLEGVSDYDARRPVVPTGTNLLGLVKHLATLELKYLGDTFDRPHKETLPDAADPTADLWATAEETRVDIIGLYQRAWAHADATIETLPLDAIGHVPWWGEHGEVTLHRILVHVIAETDRHAGHADILRELIDGSAGLDPDNDNLAIEEPDKWADYREKLEVIAREAS
jgi:Protein of unknown function (DUF664)